MVLWLKGNEFGIFRSIDLENWDQTQTVFLEDAWECPDLFRLTSSEGEKQWFFWSADGYYFPGTFDGYRFVNHGERHKAYISKIPYAAQTFSGVEDRVISIPWLRLENDGRLFTGSYGIPTEMSWHRVHDRSFLIQRPVKEFYEQLEPVDPRRIIPEDGFILYENRNHDRVFFTSMILSGHYGDTYEWEINSSRITYSPNSGILTVNGEKFQAGTDYHKVEMIVDDRILEVFFDGGAGFGTFSLADRTVRFRMDENMVEHIDYFEIR